MTIDMHAVAQARADGRTWREIGAAVGASPDHVRKVYKGYLAAQGCTPAQCGPGPDTFKPEEINVVVRPFEVPLAPRPETTTSGILRAAIIGDTHSVFIDERAESIALQIVREFNPHVLVHVGDAMDCYKLSSFDKDPLRIDSLDDELERTRETLWRFAEAAPISERYLLEGNHEDRLRRALWKSEGPQREILRLRAVQKTLTWPSLLHLDEIGYTWVPTREQSRLTLLPKFMLKHGTIVRKHSAYTARAEHEQYGMSGASGHTHRLGLYMQKDRNGNHMWWETGCLCQLDPDYIPGQPNWQQGFLLAEFDVQTGAPSVTPVYIHDGLAVWRGQRYSA